MTEQPTADTITALKTYAAENGRTWKTKLNDAWMAGGYNATTGRYIDPLLQQLRNQFGPSWLVNHGAKAVR